MTRLPLITNSESTTMRRCAREHRIAYVLGYRPVESADALRVGTIVHAGLEAYWSDARFVVPDGDPYEAARIAAMLDGYHARWRKDEYETIGVEMQFRAPLVNPATGAASTAYEIGGKLDALARDARGDVWIVEHKTSSQDISPGSQYWAKLRIDSQISTYMVGARALGYEPRGVLYDVLGKPKQEMKQIPIIDDDAKVVRDANGARVRTKDGKKWRETGDVALGYVLQTRDETPSEYADRVHEAIVAKPEAYYQREEVVRLAKEEFEAAQDTWHIAAQIRVARRTGIAPRNPDACSRYGRMCPYWAVCTGETSLENPARYRRVDHVHQELEAAQ